MMETRVIRAWGDEERDRSLMEEAGRLIREGELVAIPTETVYGLAVDALNPASAKKPGPLTLIFKKSSAVPRETTGGLDTVAVRMPVNRIAAEFIRASGGYIAAPSANASGRPSCTTAEHVYEDMKGKIPLIIDGGEVGIGLESTIVDLSGDRPCLLRPGYISLNRLMEKIGEVDTDPSIEGVMDENAHPKAPGIVKGDPDRVRERINSLCLEGTKKGLRTAVLSSDETVNDYRADIVRSLGSRQDEESIARNLFKVLRDMDDEGADLIYTEEFNTADMGMAIMNRLIRAAGHRIIEC